MSTNNVSRFKLAIEVCFENYFGLIHVIFLLLGSTKSIYFFLGHPVDNRFARIDGRSVHGRGGGRFQLIL